MYHYFIEVLMHLLICIFEAREREKVTNNALGKHARAVIMIVIIAHFTSS